MVMKVLRQGAFGGFLKYVLMSLLALSVLGLVFMDVRGVLQGQSITGTDVARVGSESIGIREFDKFARLSLSRFNMTPEDAYNKNPQLMDEILGTEIRARFILLEAESVGISIGQKKLQEELIKRIKPLQEDGETFQQTLDRLLRSQGVREGDFVKNYNREIVGDILLEGSQDGFGVINADMARDLFLLQNHKRDLEMISFAESDITSIEQPDEERLKRLYDSYKNTQFRIPEMRVLEIAFIDDSKLKETIDVSEESLRKHYEENIDDYKVGEQRFLEQAIAPSADQAKSILKLVEDDKVPMKEAMVRILGEDEGTYVPSAPFSNDMIIGNIRDAITNAKSGDAVGPVQTVMGHHIISVGNTIPEHTQSFEEVREGLKREMEQIALGDTVYELSNQLDDVMAGGNTIEDAASTIPLKITTLSPMTSAGLDANEKDVFETADEQDKGDREIILEEGFALQPGETSRVFELPSGRFAVLAVKDVIEQSSKPYEQVKQKIMDDFIHEQQRVENFRKLSQFVKQIKAGEKTFEEVAKESGKKIENIEGIVLAGGMPQPLKEDQRPMIFESRVGDLLTLPLEGGSALVRIKAAHLPEIDSKMEENIARIKDELAKETKDEVFNYYVQRIGEKYPAAVNHALLDQVYGRSESSGDTQ